MAGVRKQEFHTPAEAAAPLTVLLLPGVVTPRRRLRGWMHTLARRLPDTQPIIPSGCFYWLWASGRQRRALDGAERALRRAPGPVWLLAHSFGGLIARALLARCPDAPIVLLTTMASPHAYPFLGIRAQAQRLGVPAACAVPALSYGGTRDLIVPHPWTVLPGALAHRNLRCGHLDFLFEARVREAVLADALGLLRVAQRA